MQLRLRVSQGLTLVALMALFAAPAAAVSHSGSSSITLGPNLGTLNYDYTVTVTAPGACQSVYTSYYSFEYKNSGAGISQPISGSTYSQFVSCPEGTTYGPAINYDGNGYTIHIPGGLNGESTISVPGYVNPRYKVVGVIYAPPGHKSDVDYTNSNLVSSTITTKQSLGTSYSENNTVLYSYTYAWKNGKIDTSVSPSTTWTQSTTTTDSTAITIQKSTGTSVEVLGPVCDYCGVDHDYDLIAVWLNPVVLFTLTNNGVVQPNGYGFSSYDQPGVDVYYVYAGELNGDFALRSSTTTAFARSWASVFMWPAGQGPALTTQDKQNILEIDPYWNCTYESPIDDPTYCAEPPSSTRFTESTEGSFPYQQPIPGGQPIQKGYQWSYTNTDTQGKDVTQTVTETFSLEEVFGVSIFGFGFQDTLKETWTTTGTYETSSQFTSTNTSTAAASITGPGCTVVDGACSPMYPPANAYDPVTCAPLQLATSFGQGDNIYIYQDNLFGTFMFEPYGQ